MKIYFDGGCRPNPGEMKACLVILHNNGKTEPMVLDSLGHGTNNVAEWSALIWAAVVAREQGTGQVTLIGDSQLVINQASRKWKINDETLSSLFKEFQKVSKGLDFELRHVPRERNLAGRFLEKGQL